MGNIVSGVAKGIMWLFLGLFALGMIGGLFDGSLNIPAVLTLVVVGVLVYKAYIWLRSKHSGQLTIQQETEGAVFLRTLQEGSFMAAHPRSALLRAGETAVMVAPATWREEQSVGVRHGGQNIRLRIMKGVSVSTGKGHSTREKAWVDVAFGEFVITTERIIFAGDKKSFEIPLQKLTNTTYYSDGLGLNAGSKSHLVIFSDPAWAQAGYALIPVMTKGGFQFEQTTS